MLRSITILLTTLMLFSGVAHAKTLTYTIDHGTVGVITSKTQQSRLIIQATGECKSSAYSVVTDGVLAASGNFDLSKKRSMPMDYTILTLSCTDKAVMVNVNQPDSSVLEY